MLRRSITLLVLVLFGALLLTSSGVATSARATAKLKLSISGPSKTVAGSTVSNLLVLKNTGTVKFGEVKLFFVLGGGKLAEILTQVRGCKPYKPVYSAISKVYVAYWRLKNFRPGAKFACRLTLRFPSEYKGQQVLTWLYHAEAKAKRPSARASAKKFVEFTQSPSG